MVFYKFLGKNIVQFGIFFKVYFLAGTLKKCEVSANKKGWPCRKTKSKLVVNSRKDIGSGI